jgi:LacI family transcriptional regulator
MTIVCPHCRQDNGQVKAGYSNGKQRYKCSHCQRRYIPERRQPGYPEETRSRAIRLHAEGSKIRQIARELSVNHQTVTNWLREHARAQDQAAPGASPSPPDPGQAGVPQKDATQPPKRRSTISDVAKRAGVSTATVSSFINQKGRMRASTRRRIQAAIEELHYTPNALVRAIRQQRTHILGVVIFGLRGLDTDLGQSLTPMLLAGISQAADLAEHDILLYSGWPHNSKRHTGLNFLDGHIDGLLWAAPAMHEPAMERAAAAGLPVVALLTRHVPEAVGYVNADNITPIHQIFDHLMALGHRRIAYIGPNQASNFIDRYAAFLGAQEAHGVTRDERLESVIATPWTNEACAEAVDRWLSLPQPPTAVIAADDGIAYGICQALNRRGLRVPADVAVTGFNDILDAHHICGGLTTIRQPFHEVGRLATEKLVALIEGAPVDQCRVTTPVTMVTRYSTTGHREWEDRT